MTVVKQPSPMSKLFNAVIVGIVIITVIATSFVITRPVWGRFQDNLDDIITDLGVTEVSTNWTDTQAVVNGLWWLLPVIFIGMIIWWIWMTSQEKDYITVGYR